MKKLFAMLLLFSMLLTPCIRAGFADDNIPVEGISLLMTELTLRTDETTTLYAVLNPSAPTNPGIVWSSSDENVVKTAYAAEEIGGTSCEITAQSSGEAKITATTVDGGFSAECKVIVASDENELTGISLSSETLSLQCGSFTQLEVIPTPLSAQLPKNILWTSNDNSVAIVNKGKVYAISSQGRNSTDTATITATDESGKFSASCEVQVTGLAPDIAFVEDFNDVEAVKANWTFIDADNDGVSWIPFYDSEHIHSDIMEGNGMLCSEVSGIFTDAIREPDNWAISQPITIDPQKKYCVSIFTSGTGILNTDENAEHPYSIYVLPKDYKDVSEAVVVYESTTGNDWTQIRIGELNSYIAQFGEDNTFRIAIRHLSPVEIIAVSSV